MAFIASPVLLPHEIEREVESEFPEIGSIGRKVEPNPAGKGGNFQDGRLIAGRKGIHVPVLFKNREFFFLAFIGRGLVDPRLADVFPKGV